MSLSWPNPALSAAAPVREALQRAMAMVGVASGLVASGRVIELDGLDAVAGALCAKVLDLPPAEGRTFRPALVDLEAKIIALSCVLRGAAGHG